MKKSKRPKNVRQPTPERRVAVEYMTRRIKPFTCDSCAGHGYTDRTAVLTKSLQSAICKQCNGTGRLPEILSCAN